MKAITFLLHTKQPILATSLQGDPNSDVSFPYIPGSMIRGVLISRYLQHHGLKNTDDILDDAKFPDVKRLFFDGRTRYLNAYLYSHDKEKRTLPVTRSWLKKKGDEVNDSNHVNIYDFSYEKPDPKLSYKSLNEGFCTTDDENIVLYKEKRRINIHNMRDRKKGRGTDDNGAVFRYDALDAGQTFQGVILCDNPDDVAKIKPLLELEDIFLGGSRKAGYGHNQISHIEELDIWHEIGIDPEYREDRELLRITLLSDLILRDRWGQYVAMPPMQLVTDEGEREVDPLTQLLEELLEVKLESQSCFISSLVVGGFNRKWGLPLPQVPALAAGSVFVFKYEGELNIDHIDRIRTLENQGIGERRVDGFGRLAVNWLEEKPKFEAQLPESETKWVEPKLEPDTEDSQIAAKMAKRLLEQKLAMRLLAKVDRIKLKPNKLSNSQLSRLIIVARQALTEESKNPVIYLLEHLPKNATGQFEETKIDGTSLKNQICNWLNEPSTWIDSKDLEVKIAGAEVSSNLVERLKLEYTLRLIMGIAKKATKENQNE